MQGSTFIPFGEFLPDRRQLNNSGLVRAWGVVPLSGNYIRAPHSKFVGTPFPAPPIPLSQCSNFDPPLGFYIHSPTYGYYGTEEKLVEIELADATERIVTRLVGGPYAFAGSPPFDDEFWWFTSFGENVIATNLEDDVQFLPTPGVGDFEKLITSTFQPRAKLAFPVLGNMFLANLALDATYDGLAVGPHTQLVAWSQSHNVRAYGSARANPELVGAGYQQLDNDFGEITAGIGGEFGIIFQEGGIVRVDGPPYELRPIVAGDSTLYPYSVFRLGEDVYFWGAGGPSVLRGGMPPVVRLGLGKLQRSLLDHLTGFGADFARAAYLKLREVSGAADPVNELLRWSYRPNADARAVTEGGSAEGGVNGSGGPPTLFLDHSLTEERFAVSRSACDSTFGSNVLQATRDLFLRSAPATPTDSWGPYARVYALHVEDNPNNNAYLIHFELNENFNTSYPDLVLETGFGRLEEDAVTRVAAVRPVWTGTPANVAAISAGLSVTVRTKNKPYEASTDAGPTTDVDEDGWVPIPESVYGSYHAVTLRFGGLDAHDANEIHEIEGFEVRYEVGGKHGT